MYVIISRILCFFDIGEDEIVKEIGTGTFGKVFKCNDRKYNDVVAIKVVRGIKKYVDSAKIEASILDDVYTRQKRNGVDCCLKLYSHFPLNGISLSTFRGAAAR